ncbi:MAG: ABC transporter substrate-binding protein [Capsulimonadales bacterium]|nr:ABC transporter substrate-binding protein [Capsulimonadales bacterium]
MATEPTTPEEPTIPDARSTRREALGRLLGTAGTLAAVAVLATPPPPRPRTRRVPVRFWHMWTAEWEAVIREIADRFNESQSRYEVIPLSVPTASADSKFLLAAVGGDPPDMMAQWNLVLATWAENGVLFPLEELMSAEDRRTLRTDTYSFVRKVGRFQDKLYAIGIGPNLSVCFYRTDHFRDAGLDPDRFPTTLEELTQAGETLTRFDRTGRLKRIGFLPTEYPQFAGLFGGGFYDETTGTVSLNTPPNRRALEYLAEAHRKLGFENIVRFTSGLTGDSGGSVDWPFISGAYSIVVDGQWRIEQLAKFAPDLPYRTAPLPPPNGGTPNAGWANADMLLIPRDARQPEGAWEFIRFWSGLTRPETAAEFFLRGGWLPIRPAIAESPIYRDYVRKYPALRTFLEVLPSPNLQPPPPVPYQAFLADSISRMQDLVKRGTLTPERALETLETDIRQERQRRRKLGYAE